MTEVSFQGWASRVQKAQYENGRTALQLVDAQDGEPVATATINLPDEPLAEGEVFVKDYSKNRGIKSALTLAGIIEPTGRFAKAVHAERCKLTGRGL